MPQLARLLLLLIALAVMWNLARGTLRPWLRAKFLGDTPAPARSPGGRRTGPPPRPTVTRA